MFETMVLPEVAVVTSVDDAGLIDVMGDSARLEAAMMARRLAAIAELYHRRLAAEHSEDRGQWQIDGWDGVAAEVAAAQGISRGRASGLIDVALTLRDRLPRVAQVFAEGRVDYRVVAVIASRTDLVTGDDALAAIDAKLSQGLQRCNRLSYKKIAEIIDWWIDHFDQLAKKPARDADADRHVGVASTRHGMAELWGVLRAPDAVALDMRLSELADTVCADDPRTKVQRRADAAGALAAGAKCLVCLCGRDECPAVTAEPAGTDIVIHVLSEAATMYDGAAAPGYVPGFGGLSADAVRDLAKSAKLRPVIHPGDAPAEPGYRPSKALADFIRCRDLTCRFPNCDAPAEICDIDHTVPYPHGPTHASNLTLKCRHHHLLKTFYTGVGGWNDRQLPDGTVIWTSPTGHTYTTKPGGALFFPQLAVPTGTLVLPSEDPPITSGRGLMMPTRARTRAQNRLARIRYERGLNHERFVLDAEPPPF